MSKLPRKLTQEEAQQLAEAAAAKGTRVTDGWNLDSQLGVLRENMARYAHDPAAQHMVQHATFLGEQLLEDLGPPSQQRGELLIFLACFLGGLTVQGAPPAFLTNILSVCGYQEYTATAPTDGDGQYGSDERGADDQA